MRNSDFPYRHERIFDLWHIYRTGDTTAPVLAQTLDPLILASWERCTHIYSQVSSAKTHANRNKAAAGLSQHQDLMSVAVPYIEDIHQVIEGAPGCVILTDGEGVILAAEGSSGTMLNLHRIGVTVGKSWAESRMGTNAIGLSLVTAMPVQVVGAEHYLQLLHSYGASAVPIHDEQGAIVGTIALLTYAERTDPLQLALVMATARAIANQLQANQNLAQANRRLRQLDSILAAVTDGVITWNISGQVEHVNTMACQMLGISSTWLLGKPLDQLMLFPPYIQQLVLHPRELNDIEIRVQIDNRILQCLVSVRPIYDGMRNLMGGAAMLRPLSQVRSLVSQQANTYASVTFSDFSYESEEMQAVLRQARLAAKGVAPVLLIGEVGVGKTALAQAIHNASPRAARPFVVVSCGMTPSEFMVEELLGKEAQIDQPGRPSKFELADGGTLMIDSIDQLSLEAQQILLNVISSRTVNRLYATRPISVNVRIIATTASHLEDLIRHNGFLPQLYFQFNAFRLRIPPLRERRRDVVRLAKRFLERASTPEVPFEMDAEVLELIQNYPWPANVRELESVIERAIVNAESHCLRVQDLPENIRTEHSLRPGAQLPQAAVSLWQAEREAIIAAGWACQGVIIDMAALLGINRSTLWRKLKEHGISAQHFKQGFSAFTS